LGWLPQESFDAMVAEMAAHDLAFAARIKAWGGRGGE